MNRIESRSVPPAGAPSNDHKNQQNSRSQTLAALRLAVAETSTHRLHPQATSRRIREERDWLARLLARMGIEAWCSPTDAVLAHFGDPDRIEAELLARGAVVSRYSGRPELRDWLILRVPGRSQPFEALCQAIVDVVS